jgi:hypothetical protein
VRAIFKLALAAAICASGPALAQHAAETNAGEHRREAIPGHHHTFYGSIRERRYGEAHRTRAHSSPRFAGAGDRYELHFNNASGPNAGAPLVGNTYGYPGDFENGPFLNDGSASAADNPSVPGDTGFPFQRF